MSSDATCIFCKIAAGQIPAAKVLDSDRVIAFLDIAPVAPGHLLVVPREHYATLETVPADLLAAVARELPRLSRVLLETTGASGLNVILNNGRAAGQVVDHLHFHLVPRTGGDRFHIEWSRGKSDPAALADMRDRIARAL